MSLSECTREECVRNTQLHLIAYLEICSSVSFSGLTVTEDLNV